MHSPRGTTWRGRLLVTAATVIALTAVTGTALAALGPRAGPPVVRHAVAADGMAASVTHATEVGRPHEHDQVNTGGGAGFQMPLQMMPGMPAEGQVRLSVALTLANTADAGRPIDPPAEFALTDLRTGDSWPAFSDTFGGLPRLGPATEVNGTLFFDLPPPDANAQLVIDWKRDGRSYRLAVPLNGKFGGHLHES